MGGFYCRRVQGGIHGCTLRALAIAVIAAIGVSVGASASAQAFVPTASKRAEAEAALDAALDVRDTMRARAAAQQNGSARAAHSPTTIGDADIVRTSAQLAGSMRYLSPADQALASQLLARPGSGGSAWAYFYYSTPMLSKCASGTCVHYTLTSQHAVDSTDTTPANGTPDYVDEILTMFNDVRAAEHAAAPGIDWPDVVGDGTKGGGTDQVDVYLGEIEQFGIYGYAMADEPQYALEQYGHMVLDNDYAGAGAGNELDAARVTAAHEYAHLIQFGRNIWFDSWWAESSATWMEEQVYPAINDYVGYVPSFAAAPDVPITSYEDAGPLRKYGAAVFHHFLESDLGTNAVMRDGWVSAEARNDRSFAPDDIGVGITDNGGTGFSESFAEFAVATAEWGVDVVADAFPDAPYAQAVVRDADDLIVGGAAVSTVLDHTTYRLYNVQIPSAGVTEIEFSATFEGTDSAIALVGRDNDAAPDDLTIVQQFLPAGGTGTVQLTIPADPGDFEKITAVVINARAEKTSFNNTKYDWNWSGDDQDVTEIWVRATNDAVAPVAPTTSVSSSHTVNGPAWGAGTVSITPGGASDGETSVVGYRWTVDSSAVTAVDNSHSFAAAGADIDMDASSGNDRYVHLAAVDAGGNVSSTVDLGPYWADGTGPETKTINGDAAATFQTSKAISVPWNIADSMSGLDEGKIYLRSATATTGIGNYVVWRTGLAGSGTTSLTGAFGYTYCFYAAGTDLAGNASGYGTGACTAIPLNDTQLSGKYFSRVTKSGYFGGTVSAATRQGAMLYKSVRTRQVNVVVTKCSTCGTIGVYLGSTLLKKIDTRASTMQRSQHIAVARFGTTKTGTLKIVVLSSGKPVYIEGVGVRAV